MEKAISAGDEIRQKSVVGASGAYIRGTVTGQMIKNVLKALKRF